MTRGRRTSGSGESARTGGLAGKDKVRPRTTTVACADRKTKRKLHGSRKVHGSTPLDLRSGEISILRRVGGERRVGETLRVQTGVQESKRSLYPNLEEKDNLRFPYGGGKGI